MNAYSIYSGKSLKRHQIHFQGIQTARMSPSFKIDLKHVVPSKEKILRNQIGQQQHGFLISDSRNRVLLHSPLFHKKASDHLDTLI